VLEEQLDQREIPGEGRPHQRGREDDARRAFAHAGARRVVDERVRIGAGVEQLADERRILRHHPREVRRRLHVAPIGRPNSGVNRCASAWLTSAWRSTRNDHVVVAVEDRQRQRRLPVAGDRVDVGAGTDQDAGQLQAAFARGEHQRRQPAAGELLRFFLRPLRGRSAPLEAAAVGSGDVVRPIVDVRACRDQQPGGLGVSLGHRPSTCVPPTSPAR
jgi:hypothetical protein